MRRQIGGTFKAKQPQWARSNPYYMRLAELDALLDGEFYDCLPHSFYEDTTTGGKYVQLKRRRPSFQFNLYNMVADQIARKLFAGRHAPLLVHQDTEVKAKLDALKEECKLEAKMVEAAHWGSIGSVCTVFQIVPFVSDGKKCSKVVVTNVRSKFCTPSFNKLDELSNLRVHYPVQGCDYLNAEQPVTVDFEGKPVKADNAYWFIQEFDSNTEKTYKPVPIDKWAPQEGRTVALIVEDGGEVQHNLGFVPAHWHRYRTGKLRPYDGRCYWEPAVPNIIDLDYTISIIGSGIRYNAIPQVVVKGPVVNLEQDGALGRGANRFIQINADMKEGDVEEKNSDVKMLEAVGNAMKIGVEIWAALVLRVAMQQICASLKDPDKLTTAMSGKGMEVLEGEFLDLSQELRTTFGDDGYLKLLKKIAAACVKKNHRITEGLTTQQIDAVTFGWPPLSGIGMAEVQAMAEGLAKLAGGTKEVPAKILTEAEARQFALSQLDMPVISANKDYLPSVQSNEPPKVETEPEDKDDDEESARKQATDALAIDALALIDRGPLDTKPVGFDL